MGSNLIPSRAALGLGREEGMLAMLPRFASLPDFADVNSPAQLLSVTNTHCAKLGPKTRLETTSAQGALYHEATLRVRFSKRLWLGCFSYG